MSVLKLKDENGNWVGIPTIKGDKGDDGIYVEGNPNGAATDGDLIKIKIGSKIFSIHDYTEAINSKLDKVTTTSTYPQAYIKHTDGNQIMMDVDSNVVANSIVSRDSNGNANIATPATDQHIANKGYVDTADAKKVDKKTTTGYFAYTHDGTTQGELKISQSNDGSTLVQRNSAGQIYTATPTDAMHCATKTYVDGKIPHLYEHVITIGGTTQLTAHVMFRIFSTKSDPYQLATIVQQYKGQLLPASGPNYYEEGEYHHVWAVRISDSGNFIWSKTTDNYGEEFTPSSPFLDTINQLF